MNQRVLAKLLLLFACLSVLVLLVVLSGIQNTRKPFWDKTPLSVNLLLQSNRSMNMFDESLRDLQLNRLKPTPINAEPSIQLVNARFQFDILWGSLTDFIERFPVENSSSDLVESVCIELNDFLTNSESLMDSMYIPSDQEIENLLTRTEYLSSRIFLLGRDYFVETTHQSDTGAANLETLVDYMRLFIALLIFTGGLGIGLLTYSNRRTDKLFDDAENARTELAAKADELRSGRREQKAKDSFIASASHDLRQPLHALGLFLNNLEDDVKAGGKFALKGAIHCTEDLNRLFNSMLDLSRLDAGMVVVENEDFNLREMMNKLHVELLPQAKAKGITIAMCIDGDSSCAYSDPVLISRILRNLIENAITHSQATLINIHYDCIPAGCSITISDNGCGIPEAEHEAVFSEYYQLNNPERDRSKGMGLGLSIVKRLTKLLDLPLIISSSEQSGTAFKMLVPKSENQPALYDHLSKQKPIKTDYSHLHGAVVVVVDDDSSIRQAMQMMLSKHSVVSICVETADEALDALADHHLEPDLIIADYRLRNHTTGDNVIYEMREAIEQTIPGLIITGDTSLTRMTSLKNSGLDTLHKPVEPDVLYQKIGQLLTVKSIAV